MTTSIVHGDPGSFKTATLVDQYGVPALYEGRTVVTNIRGFHDLKLIEKHYGKPLPKEANIIAKPFTRSGFRDMARFFHWAPSGALILMDEGQCVYPTRLKNLSSFDCDPPRVTGYVCELTGEPEDIQTVEEAFDRHRHMNWDIYISTPNIEKMHKEIRQVAEFGYRQRGYETISPLIKLILGDFKRVRHNSENKGNSESQAIFTTSHRINKKVFKVYKSTATGKAKKTHTKSSLMGQPKLLLALGFLLFTVYRFADNYFTYGSVFPSNQQVRAVDAPDSTLRQDSQTDSKPVSLASQSGIASDRGVSSDHVFDWVPDKSGSRGLVNSITGWTGTIHKTGKDPVHRFEIKAGSDYLSVDSSELKLLGYHVKELNNFLIIHADGFSRIVHPARHEFVDKDNQRFGDKEST
jgi:zona occludens toxin